MRYFSSVDAYEINRSWWVLAVQSTGNIQYSDNYMMSQNYRYHDSLKTQEKHLKGIINIIDYLYMMLMILVINRLR